MASPHTGIHLAFDALTGLQTGLRQRRGKWPCPTTHAVKDGKGRRVTPVRGQSDCFTFINSLVCESDFRRALGSHIFRASLHD